MTEMNSTDEKNRGAFCCMGARKTGVTSLVPLRSSFRTGPHGTLLTLTVAAESNAEVEKLNRKVFAAWFQSKRAKENLTARAALQRFLCVHSLRPVKVTTAEGNCRGFPRVPSVGQSPLTS